jgi:hypothetical protein
MTRVYAVRTDLVAYLEGSPLQVRIPEEPSSTRLLTRASEKVDDMLLGALYAVDDDSMPTHPTVIDAFTLATCAQAAWWLETGDETGAGELWDSVSMLSVALSRRAKGSERASTYSSDAIGHLRRAASNELILGVTVQL